MNEKNMPCAYWREGEICAKGTEPGYTDFCVLGPCSLMRPSNADNIRKMSDVELAQWLAGCVLNITDGKQLNDATAAWLEWLTQEVESAE